jgi:SulP family sulfate permease
MFELRGPLFFGAASRLNDALDAAFPPPRAFVLRFHDVPLADASGAGALERFLKRCEKHGVAVVFCEMTPSVSSTLSRLGLLSHVETAATYEEAVTLAAVAAERGGGAHAP